jgi:hypothetical protein
MKRHIPLLLLAGVLAGAITGTLLDHRAEASRNSGGTYSLPTGNPVVSGTTITSTWANGTLTDIGTELTNSLDRQGRGAMTAPLQHSSGSAAAPSMTFSSETNSGLYRVSANDIGMSVASSKKQEWTTTGTAVTGTLSVSGASNLSGGASITGSTIVDAAGANVGTMSPALNFGGGGEAISSRRTVGSGVGGMDFWTASVNRLSINNSGGIQVPGEYATTPGTAITGSYAGSFNVVTGTITAQSLATFTSLTLTGAALNGVCEISPQNTTLGQLIPRCVVAAANTITIILHNPGSTSASLGTVTFGVRVWNP